MTDDRKRLSGMLNFAAEILAARETVRFDMGSGGGIVLREEAIAHLPGIHLAGDDVWMRLVRMRETAPPALPEQFEEWLDGPITNPERLPQLHSERMVRVDIETASDLVEAGFATSECCHSIQETDLDTGESRIIDSEVLIHLKLHRLDEFRMEFEKWVASAWKPWAQEESPRRKSIRIYQALFKLHGMMQGGADTSAFELVWGIGITRWRKPGQQALDLPLIEQLADIELEESGDLIIRPRLIRPQLVMAPFLALDVPQAHQTQAALEPLLAARYGDPDITLSPFDPFTYEDILQAAVARLTDSARYVPRADITEGWRVAEPAPDLVIYGLWALYARPRSEHMRREDLQALARKVEQAEGEEAIPKPLRGFVRHLQVQNPGEDDDFSFGPDFFAKSGTGGVSLEGRPPLGKVASSNPAVFDGGRQHREGYFFPLPYNDEQARIIETLEEKGVAVVTGPPGTGKSHSIANIIAHYMATDRRVLVTAKTAESISVVQEKLPETLRRMTIAVVHSDREGAKQLEDAVSAMSSEARAVDRREMAQRIRDLETQIVAIDDAALKIDAQLGAIARANLQSISYCGRELLPMDLAELLRSEREVHGWFTDRPGPGTLANISKGAIEEIRALRAQLGQDMVYLGHEMFLRPEDLPGARELIEANAQAAESHGRPVEDFTGAPMMVRDDASAEERGRALASVLIETDRWLVGCPTWAQVLYRAEVALRLPGAAQSSDEPDPAVTAISRLKEFLRTTESLQPGLCDWPSVLPDPAEFWNAVGELAQGRQPIGFMARLFKRDLKRALEKVWIDGAHPELPGAWATVLDTRRWRNAYKALLSKWPVRTFPELPHLKADPAETRVILASLLDRVHDLVTRAERVPELVDETRSLFLYGLTIDDDFRQADHARIRWALRANLTDDVIPHPALESLERAAKAGAGPVYDLLGDLLGAIDGPAVEPAEIVEARNAIAADLVRLHDLTPDLKRLQELLDVLANAGAPAWAAAVADPGPAEDAVLPTSWRAAWGWGEAMAKMEAIYGLENSDSLREAKAGLMRDRRRLFEQVILARTLFSLNRRIDRVHSALANFTQAVRRLGKGTGKEAPRWRKEIRRAAMDAAPAAPVWIMPEHKVSEQLPKIVGDFDLVILDEASQSDITALAALARGKRLLIVGDEEQVSPTAIGVTGQKVAELRTRFLTDLPHRNMIDAESSIFDLAQMMFPRCQIMLREHFRSVAPIIAFSSQFYQGGLIPLRIPKASERLDPPLIDIYLPEGAREIGRNVNPDEAAVIVEEIARIVADPDMKGRSIGVISLIGRHQADVIERALMESPAVGLEEMQAHRIVCGDSTTLQGQERDIIFLSMVTDRLHARSMGDRKTAQRFNVAMSRARDRLYLVRSVARSHLGQADLKHKVIAHFREPMRDGAKVVDTSLIDRCQSGFEREVCRQLLEAGYRVIPQMKAGVYSIDLVVEGIEDRRLAIELDGDRYHGPERWEGDMARQAALERAGWVFWRVFGSQWNADPDYWWRRLVERLEECGIAPIGSAAINEAYTEHRIVRIGAEPEVVADPEIAAQTIVAGDERTERPHPKVLPPATSPLGTATEPEAETIASSGALAPPVPGEAVFPGHAQNPSVERGEQRMLPGLGEENIASRRLPKDEISFHLEETQPEIVGPDMDIVLYYPESERRRTIRISKQEHAPHNNLIHIGQPLAQALIGITIGETVELNQSGKTVRIVVERIYSKAEAAD